MRDLRTSGLSLRAHCVSPGRPVFTYGVPGRFVGLGRRNHFNENGPQPCRDDRTIVETVIECAKPRSGARCRRKSLRQLQRGRPERRYSAIAAPASSGSRVTTKPQGVTNSKVTNQGPIGHNLYS